MILFRRGLACIVISAALGVLSPAMAQTDSYQSRYTQEQALIANLSQSQAFQDQRRLAELLTEGVMVAPDNPLRKADRDAAIVAYRRAIALGDRSAGTTVALARLLLRQDDAAGFSALRPQLRNFVLQGNGDAAYVLALDGAQNEKLAPEQLAPKLAAAAVMGSVAAVRDIADSGAVMGATVKQASLQALQRRAQTGWAPAAFALYEIYRDGRLTDRAPELSMKWLDAAVAQNYVPALERLGDHLLHGVDIAADPVRAATLYRAAAEAGSGGAAAVLGRHTPAGPNLDIPQEEARIWLQRAAAVGVRGAAAEIASLDLSAALASNADPVHLAQLIEAALAPIAQDPDALASLAQRQWRTANSKLVAPVLLPLLKDRALEGSPTAGLAYNAWLQANGEALPEAVAQALVDGLKKQPLGSAAFSDFTIANLALNGRIPEKVLSKGAALELLMDAADAKVGQAMLRLGELYAQGDALARNKAFAKRWLIAAKGQAVERAAWDLAALQLADEDPAERAVAEAFYLGRLNDGDARAALILVQHRIQSGPLDPIFLAEAKRAATEPRDVVDLAAALVSSGVQENIDAGEHLLATLRAEELPADALVAYGDLLISIAASSEDTARGLSLLEKAVEKGDPGVKIALASTYLSSVSYKDRQAQAVRLLDEVLADNPRDPNARLLMSKAYLMGLGIKRDARKASLLIDGIRAEGEFKNAKATMLAADWLAFSASERDPAAAVALLKTQAARGSIAAERAVGDAYLSGFGPTLEPDLAASRLYKSANAGDKEAMASLGHLLLNGYGVSQSREAGLRWLSRAAQAGDSSAMYELSRIYALAPEDDVGGRQTIYWLKRAAERNHPNASYQLGLAYQKGDWVEANPEEAAKWFKRAGDSGNLLAARTLDALRREQADPQAPEASDGSPE